MPSLTCSIKKSNQFKQLNMFNYLYDLNYNLGVIWYTTQI